jgi:hypothetical protein
MDILLVTAGIKAALRAAQSGIDIYVERAVDKPIFLPNIRLPRDTINDEISHFLSENAHFRHTSPFNTGWIETDIAWFPTDIIDQQNCIAKYIELKSATDFINISDDEKNLLIGGRMIEQWRHDKEPPTAWTRIALTIADIGLEFIAANPSIMGENSKGEALVVAFATNLTELIPNDITDMGNRHDFESRLMGIFLRAGLTTLLDNNGTIIEDDNIEALVKGIIKPINDALPVAFNEQIRYRALIEALMGPSAAAALNIIASNTSSYLGDEFVDDKALGAVTKALLAASAQATSNNDITAVFTKHGVTSLFDSALSVAVSKPHLFIDQQTGEPRTEFITSLFVNTAATIKEANSNGFNKNLGLALSAMVIDTVGEHADLLLMLDPEKPWENVAITLIQNITQNLSDAIENNTRFLLFSQEQKFEYTRIILQQTAQTPSMIGAQNPEFQRIIAGIAEVMVDDEHLLLSNNEWIKIASTAAQLASVNPERLFGISDDSQVPKKLAVTVLKAILPIINDSLVNTPLSPLRGYTLTTALELVLNALASNITGIINNPSIIEIYFIDLIAKINQDLAKWGSEAILNYIQQTIENVVSTGELAN